MRVGKDVYFAVVPEWVLLSGVSAQAIRLYAVLDRYANSNGEGTPARKKLAEKLHVRSARTVDAALKELEEIGALRKQPRFTPEGDPTSNLYVLNATPPALRRSSRKQHDRIADDCSQNESHFNERDLSIKGLDRENFYLEGSGS
jgi:hypothetical protein